MSGEPTVPRPDDQAWRRALLTTSLDAVILMDGDGRIVDFNDEASSLFGLDPATAPGCPLADMIVPEELRPAHRAGLARYVATGQSHIIGQRIEVEAIGADGCRVPIELTLGVLQASPPVFIAHLRDIRTRVLSERRLRATAAVGQALAEAATPERARAGVLRALGEALGWRTLQLWHVRSDDGLLESGETWFDPAWPGALEAVRTGGFARGEGLPGRVWESGEPEWLEEASVPSWVRRRDALKAAGIASGMAFPVRSGTRTIAIIEGFASDVWPREPELLAVLAAIGGQLGHFLDQLEARAEAERAWRQAEDANRMKDEFLSVASHELRTPLNAVMGWAHLLREGRLEGDAAAKAIEAIERNTIVQARLVNDLLDMSRIVAGKFHLDLESIDPLLALEAAVDVVRPAADAKRIRLTMHLPEGEAAPLTADAGRLQQVFWNVLSNAVKFTPRDGVIDVQARFSDTACVVTIADSGVGIDPVFLPRLFDRFSQADQTSVRVHGGLGLGLSIAKQFMDLHGGTIAVESKGVSRGTTVTITLPADSAARDARAAQPRQAEADALADMRVLLVDADVEARAGVGAILRAAGATVEGVASTEEAIGCLSQSRFDAVVCDLAIPGLDGLWLARELQAHPPVRSADVRRVALTESASERERQRAFAAGFDAVVDKPVSHETLIAAVAGSELTRL